MKRNRGKAETTNKASKRKRRPSTPDDMREEYDFDYRKARPNRFAARMKESAERKP
jgi:hypothetical protein